MKTTIFPICLALAAAVPVSAQTPGSTTRPDQRSGAIELGAGKTNDGSLLGGKGGNIHTQDGLLKAQGSIHFLKDGKLTRIDNETRLSEGFVARPNGKITKPDGTEITLQEGQMLTLEGKLMPAPATTGTTSPRDPAHESATKPGLQDKGQSGVRGSDGREIRQ